jgi:tetratricopeptide (TPR) repeat protein
MKAGSWIVLLVAVTLGVHVAAASEQSERLYSRGLVAFHAQRYTDALKLFDQAAEADPQDAYALYYRGVTYGRLGNFAAAVSDLQAALGKKPDLPQAPLELGLALVQTGAFREAVPWLERAQAAPDLDGQASLLLGTAQLRLDQLDTARQSFARAANRDPSLEVAARYYQGVIDYREGKFAQAQEHFSYVVAKNSQSDAAREASLFLAKLRQAKRPKYQLYGALGFQYDSNVVLAPSNEAIKSGLGISKQADGRATLAAGGTYLPLRTDKVAFSVGYDFFQSLHFDLDAYNLQDHRPSAQLVVNAGPVVLGMQGRYDYYFLRADSFLQEATALPWLTIPERDFGRTDVWYRMRRRDFLKQPFSGVLDSFNHSGAIRQLIYLGQPERYVSLGYRFDSEEPINARGDQFAYDGSEVSAGIGWQLPASVGAELDYAYRNEQYSQASALPTGTARRHDDMHQVIIAFAKSLNEHLRLTAGYFATINNSNKLAFEYDRHIGSVALEARF